MQKYTERPVYITLGENGVLLITESLTQLLPAIKTKQPIDPVGTGDTFISALCVSLAAGANPLEAGLIANLASGVTIKKLGTTGTANKKEIIRLAESLNQEEKL